MYVTRSSLLGKKRHDGDHDDDDDHDACACVCLIEISAMHACMYVVYIHIVDPIFGWMAVAVERRIAVGQRGLEVIILQVCTWEEEEEEQPWQIRWRCVLERIGIRQACCN